MSYSFASLSEESTVATLRRGSGIERVEDTDDQRLLPVLLVDNGADRGRCLAMFGDGVYLLGRANDAQLRISDRSVSRRHAVFMVEQGDLQPIVALEDLGSTNGVHIDGRRMPCRRLLEDRERLLVGEVELIFRLLPRTDIEHRNLLFEEAMQAGRDALTGCRTRRFLTRSLPRLIETHRQAGLPLTMIFFDLDHFSEINTRHGHQVGDAALRAATRAIQSSIRAEDYLVRFGGEEFVAILPGATEPKGLIAAERARARVEITPVYEAPGLSITTSAGVGELRPDDDAKSWLKRVDDTLYAAKRAGRNRVVSADEREREPPSAEQVS